MTTEDPSPNRWESAAEEQIRRAQAEGEFDDLPGAGAPLPGRGRPDPPNWWARRFLERERRRQAEAEASRMGRPNLEELWVLLTEDEVLRSVEKINRELAEADQVLPAAQRRDPLDPRAVLAAWRRMYRLRP